MLIILKFLIISIIIKTSNSQSTLCKNEFTNNDKCNLLPPDTVCGQLSVSNRIRDGDEAAIGQYPWMAHISSYYIGSWGKTEDICAGYIINNQYVVTTAHCCPTTDEHRDTYNITIGARDITKEKECYDDGKCTEKAQIFKANKTIRHEKYGDISMPRGNTHEHDICLIRLSGTIQFNNVAAPICLPASQRFRNDTFDNKYVEVAAWGKTYDSYTSDKLLVITAPVVPEDKCLQWYNRTEFDSKTKEQMCAGGEWPKGTCRGDSGAPLMATFNPDNVTLRNFVIGHLSLTISGSDVCSSDHLSEFDQQTPALYLRVPLYVDWILNNLEP